ncbi:hypothetical protein [Bacillus cereus]|uniref:hypothetical protein n=1 Tax=Bacillus cereus TaxID=1396 RepID=UPI000BED9F6B|nr:hypothetical protein [Bacillus cereus]PDZ79401.1 hypothetical protein CON31_12200 [Bacillus cereus]PFB33615.1 hypothetical protein CN392_17730 [Bacillus cereus]PFO32888.1 hypothetical protein COJ82_27820 [Bacillus cereus]PFQ34285.1 hypothetical protein COK33_20340 [Bacillus cereus]PGR20165.1 hypothetical protein COA25_08610 [Bacillus cereus]
MDSVLAFFKIYGPIISVFLTITGLGAGLYYFIKNKKYKKLEYVISSKTALFNQLHSKIKIFFEEQEIKENAYLSILSIESIGNEPIKEDEFEKGKPLEIKFVKEDGMPSRVFDVEIYQSKPEEFNIEFEYTDREGTLYIKPILFNPKDYVKLKIISTKFERITISGRIIGGSVVNGEKRQKRKEYRRTMVPLISSLIFSLFSAVGMTFIKSNNLLGWTTPYNIIVIMGLIVLTTYLIIFRMKYVK